MSYVDEAFQKLKTNLEITRSEREVAKTRHKLIRDHIALEWTLEDDFLTGSYARDTKTKKLKDVDIFVVIDPTGPQCDLAKGTGWAAVGALKEILDKKWPDVEADDNVVRVNYEGDDVASYEVAPVFPRSAGGYRMPAGANWIETNPKIHGELVTEKNKECDGKFVPFVKMVKGINREAEEPILPSFLIEVMALNLVLPPFGRYQDEIRFFLASAADHITDDWSDPANLGPDINSSVSPEDRAGVARRISGWLSIAEEAILLEGEGKERGAVEQWRKLFGWRMPRP